MDDFFIPETVYLLFVLGGVAALAEASMTTFGIAAGVSLLFGTGMAFGIRAEEYVWWPLVPAAVGVLSCCIPLALHKRMRSVELLATLLLGSGSLAFGLLNGSLGTVILAALVTAAFYFSCEKIFGFVEAAANAPQVVGMDSLVGRTAAVVRWTEAYGTVQVDGTYWNAIGPHGITPGQWVEITGHDGMTLTTTLAPNSPVPPQEASTNWG